MSRQSRDMSYGRQGGRIVAWDATKATPPPACSECGQPVHGRDDDVPTHYGCEPAPTTDEGMF